MAIPKSTFVMGVVTLGLFGVAIYETSRGKQGRHERTQLSEDDDGADDSDDATTEYERDGDARRRRELEQQLEKEKQIAAAKAELRQLYDAEIAMPGALFRGVVLDSSERADRDFDARRSAFMDAVDSSITTGDNGRYDRFEIRLGVKEDFEMREALCNEMHRLLRKAWGSAALDEQGVELWINKGAGIRASFTPGAWCELAFEKFDEPAVWMGTSSTSTVPLGWVGKPAAEISKLVGVELEDDAIRWTGHGVGIGSKPTELTAIIENGRVSTIRATTVATPATQRALKAHLEKAFGEAKLEATGVLRWPAQRLQVDFDDRGTITILVTKS